MRRYLWARIVTVIGITCSPVAGLAIDVNSTVTALRLANEITGGLMPTSDPLFAQMVASVAAGNVQAAALIAANSPYFASYMARRLALQMQSPALSTGGVTDSDATAFLIAHFVGAPGVKPSISTIWSDNSTYVLNIGGTNVHAASLTATQLNTRPGLTNAVDWMASLVALPGQTVSTVSGKTVTTGVTLPAANVGGYVTLSDRSGDSSFAQYGLTAGTNLRMIEGIWEISTGLQLLDVASEQAVAADAPRFVPETNSNFFHGQGQTACIACHGGGMASVNHGYSTVADIFDYNPTTAPTAGLVYNAAPATATMKSLGSDPTKRTATLTCNLAATPTPVCNPDSAGVDSQQKWDLNLVWGQTGVLQKMGWRGPATGQGLNALGAAIGQAAIVYQFLTVRVINEVCPMGSFTQSQVNSIAALADPMASPPGSDDVRTIVAAVASQPSCL